MAAEWIEHDDTTTYFTLGNVIMVAVVYDQVGQPGWKVSVGKRSLKDKMGKKEDAQKVAVAYAERVLRQCNKEIEEIKEQMGE